MTKRLPFSFFADGSSSALGRVVSRGVEVGKGLRGEEGEPATGRGRLRDPSQDNEAGVATEVATPAGVRCGPSGSASRRQSGVAAAPCGRSVDGRRLGYASAEQPRLAVAQRGAKHKEVAPFVQFEVAHQGGSL